MAWISLPDAKKQLNKSASVNVDDDELTGFIDAACSQIEDIMGHVDVVDAEKTGCTQVLRQYRNWHPRHLHVLELTETPVLEVLSVASLDGPGSSTAIPLADPAAGVVGWELHDTVLHVPSYGLYTVAYTAGRAPVPPNYRLAALELVAHLWRGSQLNQNSGRPPVGGDQMMVLPHMASALPYRVRELLGLYGNVVNAHVVIA